MRFTGLPKTVVKKSEAGVRSLREFGVKGVAGDTARINAALQDSADYGFSLVGDHGLTIPVEQVGTKNFVGATGNVITGKPYGIEIPTGARIHWGYTTLALSTDIVGLSNKRTQAIATGTATTNLSRTLSSVTGSGWAVGQYISGPGIQANTRIVSVSLPTIVVDKQTTAAASGVAISAVRARDEIQDQGYIVDCLDRNTARTVPAVWYYGLKDSLIYGATVKNCNFIAANIGACEDTTFGALYSSALLGQGWLLGGNLADQLRRPTIIGTNEGHDIAQLNLGSQPGNPFCIGGVDVVIEGVLRGRNCAGAHKHLVFGQDYQAGYSFFDGTAMAGESYQGTNNSGTKVQGTDLSDALGTVQFAGINSKRCEGPGLYVRGAGDLSIATYDGSFNARDGVSKDIDADSFDSLVISDGMIRRAGFSAVSLGSTAGHFAGSLVIHDFSDVTGGGTGFDIGPSASGKLDRLEVMDGTTGTANTTNGSPTLTNVLAAATSGSAFREGMPISGTGIPAGTFCGYVGTSTIVMVDSSGNPVNATATGTAVAISCQRGGLKTIGGSSPATFDVESYRTNISNNIDIRSDRIRLRNPIFGTGTSSLNGVVTLTAGTQTDVANANVKTAAVSGGGYVEPLIELTPMNAAAVALGVVRYRIPSNFTFKILHATAGGTEVFAYRILEYTHRSVQFA